MNGGVVVSPNYLYPNFILYPNLTNDWRLREVWAMIEMIEFRFQTGLCLPLFKVEQLIDEDYSFSPFLSPDL